MNKYYKITWLFIGLTILFYDTLKSVYEKQIVEPILSNTKSNILVDIVFIVIVFIFIWKLYKNFINKTFISKHQLFFSCAVLILYGFIRIFENYSFLGSSLFNEIKYFDILFLYFLLSPITFLLAFLHKKKSPDLTLENLYTDSPIVQDDEDILDRNYKAKRIAEEIYETKSKEAIGFGITGEWGSGKTSFLNLLKKEIKSRNNEDFVLIDFNPWLNLGVESIIQDYFDTIQTALRPYGEDIYREIKHYSDSLLNISKSSISDTLKKVIGVTLKKNVTAEFSDLNRLLKKINKRVIVFIDDFDRLQPSEIFEILKLIRNTAGFDNFIYIVAYDKSYVKESLENFNIPNSEKFSEKIFLKEEHLIPATQGQICTFIKDSLIENIEDEDGQIANYFNVGSLFRSSEIIISLKHLRDAKRFLNSFINDYKIIKNEILFTDYFNLKLLKFKFYDVYILLFLNRSKFLNERGQYFGKGGSKYCLQNKYENDGNNNFGFRPKDHSKSILGKFIVDHLNYSEQERSEISKLMLKLFETEKYNNKHHSSIIFHQNYHKYFKDNLNINDLSEADFNEAINEDYVILHEKIDKWHSENKLDLVRYRFYEISINDIDSSEKYELIIESIFYLANLKVKNSNFKSHIFGYDHSVLLNLIDNRDSKISNKLYQGEEEPLRKFIEERFSSASSPFAFESDLLNYIINNNHKKDSFTLNDERIIELLIFYLENYLNSKDSLTNNVWLLFHNCKTIWQRIDDGNYIKQPKYFPRAQELLINFIKKDLDSFLVTFIEPQSFYGNERAGGNHIGVSTGVKNNIFGSYEAFEKFLTELDADKLEKPTYFKDEFLSFLKKFKENEYQMIEFEFTYPLAIERLESFKRG
ncbi:KAP family P-loop NTPase fold protein [Aquimarina spongiae]|uniref:KAP family P-loop domain-containing protein n=1 Tax=Aquimarina spongiae TaxID=570521 RepID=A0A1M6B7X5_9FLAO|nr:P-loop NTPase fold protein [Aquimarina spongiae]SHI44815.1 KAP family P-loop domain-containing protein [Aquimarina spongiae]